ncbi:MAG TPA: hypothetical protein VEF04_17375, partial [Blastocatellia bacterium]|nr:hypothetical protein [Blastocatellia bacterium]
HRDRYTGITLNAALGGEIVNIQRLGEATESSWNWIVDAPIYIGANGVLTQTPPVASTAAFSQIIGVAVSPTSIYLAPREPITL